MKRYRNKRNFLILPAFFIFLYQMQVHLPHREVFFQIYRWLNILLVILLPAYAVVTGLTTVFYIIYLYWWHELISSCLDGFYFHLHKKRNPGMVGANPVWGRLFILSVYFIFIVVIFGFVSNWGNKELLIMNMRVLMLRNYFFVTNLICLVLNEAWLRYNYMTKFSNAQDPFTGRMIVLHVSIIGGAVMYFWLTNEYPKTFTPENLWGSVIIAAPFLLAKAIISWNAKPSQNY